MIATALQRLFNAIYTILKLSVFFWGLVLAGGIILGIGPALQALSDLYVTHHFNYQLITFAEAWQLFKHYLVSKSILFWAATGLLAILFYNFYLSSQFQGWLWLFIDFILAFAIAFVLSTGLSALILQSHFDIQKRDLIVLAMLQFFHKSAQMLLLIVGIVALIVITWKFKAMILFFSIPLLIIWADFTNQAWIKTVEDRLATK